MQPAFLAACSAATSAETAAKTSSVDPQGAPRPRLQDHGVVHAPGIGPVRPPPDAPPGDVSADIFQYREPASGTLRSQTAKGAAHARNLIGYSVEAIGGHIGKIDEASDEVGASYIIVDTGPWIFGKKVMLAAGVVSGVDHEDETVYVNRTKDQIKASPEFDANTYRDDSYRSEVGSYYGPGGFGWEDW